MSNDIGSYGSFGLSVNMTVWFIISIGRKTLLTPTLDKADPHFARVITPGFSLHHIEVAKQNSASGSL